MILIMIASWYLYGRRHYIGPIRALTKWSAGVEIDPKAFDFDTPEGRFEALRDYLKREMNHQSPKNSNGSRAGDGTTTVSVPMLSKPIKWLSGGGTRPRTRDSSEYVELAPRTTAPALAESELVPRTNVGTFGVTAPALAESGVFPPTSHAQAGARGNWSTAESQETVVGQFSSGSDHYFERSRTQAGTQLPAIDESILDPTATHHF
jgi:hypothetical protein